MRRSRSRSPSGLYRPHNYDERFRGLVSVRTALASSLNTPAVRTLGLVGGDAFVGPASRVWASRRRPAGADYYGPSLALGSADVSLWELVGAYRALANGGRWTPAPPAPRTSPTRARRASRSQPATAFLVADILADRESRSATFGLENPLATRFWTAVKTGTSKDMRDNWCVGLLAPVTRSASGSGNFSGAPMHDVSGVTGAAPVWLEVMERLHRRRAERRAGPAAGSRRRAASPSPDDVEPPRREWMLARQRRDRLRARRWRRRDRACARR